MIPQSDYFAQEDYKAIKIHDNCHPRLKIQPMYFELGFSPVPHMFARFAVLDRLLQALQSLPQHYGFLIWDVYRPREVQGKLFAWMKNEIRNRSPHLNEEELETEVLKYVAAPSKVGDRYCSPHLSGGAIDLTLFDFSQNQPLDMGTPFDDPSDVAHRDYFTLKAEISEADLVFKERRELLRQSMEKVGFTSYQYEWWHFDLGNASWGKITKQPEAFGPLFGNHEWPNS
ncbi:M15 family metallopeptidase [Legionella jordanis]|uniref:D-alanyl-D-alanine dipeptidase n=1 Tax=Legionella jordanis TaxID=456 RepID=A0A0W0VEY9_9GAMM|nr:M15 family metallopeptidase [Legionella jordanis]KTD18658.1 D-alanyl-D-alanine dipeptidase [Legionella jordanis]RMX00833.1 D-alanyl-D-alanine dipeptidase [Legionella jordanis]VEH11534.1 D-alanyl-D-alanine dipeptidase [Legionella jordanis]HAT8715121.1 D-alanyl-D-alanine dipeptidase [Legionella jordanis]